MRQEAFSATNIYNTSLKRVLESPTIPKVFFDVRNDSDALHNHFGINLDCIQDVQLMENATRPYTKKFVTVYKGASKTTSGRRALGRQSNRQASHCLLPSMEVTLLSSILDLWRKLFWITARSMWFCCLSYERNMI